MTAAAGPGRLVDPAADHLRQPAPLVMVHGGAGKEGKNEVAYRAGLEAAADAGYTAISAGGDAVDAVCAAVRSMEDDPVFNAGYGSVLNARGEAECDAAVMRGVDQAFGAVAAVKGVRNPVLLAREVFESRWVMLVAEGAVRYGEEHGQARVDPAQLITQERFQAWANWMAAGQPDPEGQDQLEGCDTVGAVALDGSGAFAAATSTGGVAFAPSGRVGDSPLPGCGYWADPSGASSSTGEGERIARVLLCRRAVALAAEGAALSVALAEMERIAGGFGGLISVDAGGRLRAACNTAVMGVGWRAPGMTGGASELLGVAPRASTEILLEFGGAPA